MRKRNLWEEKETGRNIAIERGRQEENMEMEGKEVKAEAPGKRGRQEESMEMEGKEVKAEMAEKEKKKKRMIGMENRGYGRMGMKNGEWKKILSLALAGTMTASLIACGSGTNGADAGEGGTDGIEKARTAEAGNGGAQETENAETQEVLAQVLGSQAKTTHSSELMARFKLKRDTGFVPRQESAPVSYSQPESYSDSGMDYNSKY